MGSQVLGQSGVCSVFRGGQHWSPGSGTSMNMMSGVAVAAAAGDSFGGPQINDPTSPVSNVQYMKNAELCDRFFGKGKKRSTSQETWSM